MALYGGGGLAYYSGEQVIYHLDVLRKWHALICMSVLQAGEAPPPKVLMKTPYLCLAAFKELVLHTSMIGYTYCL
eukprot:6078778-Ditylum_brightwellii.AAC.1